MRGVLLAAFLLFCCGQPAVAEEWQRNRFSLGVESSAVWQTVNEVQIPSGSGTRFSVVDFGKGPGFSYRVYLGYRLGERAELRALFAPLTLNFSGTPTQPISYQDVVFASGVPVDASYRFNSYRLTYRYRFLVTDSWVLRAGFTAKVRDAEIRLTQAGLSSARSNVGFVPLLHLSADWRLGSRFSLFFDADALAAPQGRAEDIALQLGYAATPDLELRAGYRTVEGGSEGGGSVYTFAWLHYVTLGVVVRP